MRYQITEQNHRTGLTRDFGVFEAKTAGDALNLNAPLLVLPGWAEGCPIDCANKDTAFIAHPDDNQRIISADVIEGSK